MAKFKDKVTGNTLETDNEFALSQYRKNPERYSEVVEPKPEKPARAKKSTTA